MMRLLALDYETSGLDPVEDRIIECGACLWDTNLGMPVRLLSEFVDPLREIPPEITGLTGITDEMVAEFGVDEVQLAGRISDMVETADYVVAHYGTDFDRLFTASLYARLMMLPPDRVWIDTAVDVKYPEGIKTRNLKHLAAEHGFLPPASHRAVFDVVTMMQILQRYDLDDVIARAKEPIVYVRADVTFDGKELAKERGYRWNPDKRLWWRAFKESDYIAERSQCSFRTMVLAGSPE